ncbi:MAG: hypothetical protein V4550_14745 [Gemmatimonadota bacterium]
MVRAYTLLSFLTSILIAQSVPAAAQGTRDSASVKCNGEIVSRVEMNPLPPPFSGAARKWRAAAHAVGLHHATTRAEVIAAFVSLAPGKTCTEFRRTESERVLRAQPFLSDASVRIVPDTAGMVTVVVTTIDEVPVLVSGRFRGITPEAVSLGNENLAGEALLVQGRIERGGAYRTAVGMRLEEDVVMGHPFRLILDGERFQIGHLWSAELEHPFFTDLQRISWHTGVATRNDYIRFERPARDALALQATDRVWDASAMLRLFGTRTVTLIGGAITGRTFEPASSGIVVGDSGLVADTGSTLRNRYARYAGGRVGVIGGIRRVAFKSMRGFDALVGAQDVENGVRLGIFAGKGIPHFGEADVFLSGAVYAGAARGNALVATLAQLEGRRADAGGSWDNLVGSARSALYWGSAPGAVLVVSDELSGGSMPRLPLQLSFHELNGGLIGYRSSALAGAVRNIARAEVRVSAESFIRRADVGLAAFSTVGTLWAGDAPYGVNATRASVGVSLLAAYPTRSKRLYRADIAIPLTRSGAGAGRIEVRFTSVDRTQSFWVEPQDVSRARTGTEPSRLFAWPSK